MSFADARMPEPGDVLLGRFRIESVIGKGGMGLVFGAKQLANGVSVAIKVLSPEASVHPEAIPRFVNEARATKNLTSPHVVKVFDAGTLDIGLPFIVMELLEGRDLGAVVEAGGKLPIATALDWVIQAADAVAEAHGVGIVHRDLKPSNLFLLSRPGASPIVKVLDFGVSKISNGPKNQALTATGTFLGSPHYMPPEQLRSARDVDARADIWSLGVIVYELLAGRPPFDGGSFGELFLKVLTAEIEPIRVLRPEVPEEVEAAIARCLRRPRDERYADVGELARALAPFASEEGRRAAELVGRPRAVRAAAASPDATATPRKAALGSTLLLQDRPALPRLPGHVPPNAPRGASTSFPPTPAPPAAGPSPPGFARDPRAGAIDRHHPSAPSFVAAPHPASASRVPVAAARGPGHYPDVSSYGNAPARPASSGDFPRVPQSRPSLPSTYVASHVPQPIASGASLGDGMPPRVSKLPIAIAIGAFVVGIVGVVLIAVALRARSHATSKAAGPERSESGAASAAGPR